MTPERFAAMAKRIALADDDLSDEEIKELASMPEYESIEAFVDETLNDLNSVEYEDGDESKPVYTFNLSDVQVLAWRSYQQGKPLGNKRIIDMLVKDWGLTYRPRSEKRAQPKLVTKPLAPPMASPV